MKTEVLFIESRKKAAELLGFEILYEDHNLYETESIPYIVVEDKALYDIICSNLDNILDTKIDECRQTHNVNRFFRINDKKYYTIVKKFHNYYYIKDKNGTHKTIDNFRASITHDYNKILDAKDTYEKDINKAKRYALTITKRINLGKKFRVCYFDIETNACVDAVNTQGEILSIVCQDSLTGEIKKWILDPNKNISLLEQEKQMLEEFLAYVSEFDVLSGWNCMKFDIPYTINRALKFGIDVSIMSKSRSPVSCSNDAENMLHPWFIKVNGLNLVDMMQASVRALAYMDEKLIDSKLDTVAQALLGEAKIHTDTPAVLFKNNKIKELLDYNVQDVILLMKIDIKLGITDLLVSTLDFVPGLNLEDASYNSKIIDYYLLSKFNVVLPTVNKNQVTNIKGAVVFEPVAGIHDGVAVLDIAGMYPNLIRTFNISPDTILDEKTNDCINIGKGLWFSNDKEGILVKMITDLMTLRQKYKKLKKEHEKDPDYEIYKLREFATKKILSSVYGVFGFVGFRLFDNRIANAITTSGRALLNHMKEFAESNGFEVIAGDTDSIFVKGDIDKFEDLNKRMNESLTSFADKFNVKKQHTLSIEYETTFSRIIIPPVKKKYIGLASMVKGKKLDVPKLYFKGSELNKKDVPKGFKNIIKTLVMTVLESKEFTEYGIIQELKEKVKGMREIVYNLPISELLIFKEINRDFDAYKSKPQHVRAAECSNKYLGTDFSRMNYKGGILYVTCNEDKDAKCLFLNPNIIPDLKNFKIDYAKYYERFVDKKILLIFGQKVYDEINRKEAYLTSFFN